MRSLTLSCDKCGHVFDLDIDGAQPDIHENKIAFINRCTALREANQHLNKEAAEFDCPHRRQAVERALDR